MANRDFKYDIDLPPIDYSGEEIHEQKTQKRLWFEQTILWSGILIPTVIGTVVALAAPTWLEKMAFGGWAVASFIGFVSWMILSARGELAGVRAQLTETYKKLDDYAELLIVEEVHLVSAPEEGKEIDLKPLQEAYAMQIEKFKLERLAISLMEGRVLLRMIDEIKQNKNFIVMPAKDYQKMQDTILKTQIEMMNIVTQAGVTFNRLDKWLLKRKLMQVQRQIAMQTKPVLQEGFYWHKRAKAKIFKELEAILHDKYESYITG